MPDGSRFCPNCGQETPNASEIIKSTVSPKKLKSIKPSKTSSVNKKKKHRSGNFLKIIIFLVLSLPILAAIILLVVTISKSL